LLGVGGGLVGMVLAVGNSRSSAQPQATPPASNAKVTFSRDIAPIFQKNCTSCHGGEKPQGGLRLDSEVAALKGGESGKVLIPGDSEKSPLVRRLLGIGEEARMPVGADPLPANEIKLIRAWIDQNSFSQVGDEKDLPQAPSSPVAPTPTMPVSAHPQENGAGVFATDIRPIFAAHCYACHGAGVQQNGLRLDSLAGILHGSANGSVVVPGDSEKSRLVRRIMGLDRPQMPYGSPPLSAPEVKLIRAWIDQGARGPDSAVPLASGMPAKHWAYIKPERPEVPTVKDPAWCRNSIDNFILARLEKEGLHPSPEAAKEVLIRRVSLDLIGLPPNPDDVDAFLADHSPEAYEKVIDRLLASPHFGERWAAVWLDLARYADTHGYEKDMRREMWKYRDWVIEAFNDDMSFREFTIEQIAGDMLPQPTTEQQIASGFNRNTMTNMEGGVDPEEYYWYTQVDRVNTTATVWLGSTLGCAECHNHKFDPFTQKDYYRFLAFFAGEQYVDEYQGDPYAREPVIELPTPEQAAKSKELRAEIARQQTVLDTPTPALATAQAQWEWDLRAAETKWTVLQPSHPVSQGGATLTLLPDESVLAGGKNPPADSYEISARTSLAGITGVRVEVMRDPSLPAGGPGRDPDGNFFLSDLEVQAAPADKPASLQKIVFKEAVADESQSGYGFDNLANDKPRPKGWSIDISSDKSTTTRRGVLIPDKPFGFPGGTALTIRLKHDMAFSKCGIGRFRLSVTTMSDPRLVTTVPARLRPVLDLPPAQRREKQAADLAAAYRAIASLLQPARDQKKKLEEEVAKLGITTTLVMGERSSFERPCTHVHIRGSFLSVGDQVCAGVPFVLNPLPDDQMSNRLGLANWLVSDDNPLTARVTVNHYWEQLFGRGIVETSEDFGTQGSPPTHPLLLDWLATEFMRDGWSMKKMLRLMVTSATYRQSSSATPELEEKDPYNLLLARGPRFRVPAETIRDTALAASGLLSPKIGGPSVFPYQPAGVWDRPYNDDKWEESTGEDRYRRSLYTFIRRTSPYPSWTTFDAPTREFCTVRRVRTNTPLQALTTLNDPAFFEAAQALGRKIVQDGGADAAARATYGFRRCLTRRPTAPELDRILAYYQNEVGYFQKDPKAAGSVAKGYTGPASGLPEVAAWTMVSNVLLNLDEALTED